MTYRPKSYVLRGKSYTGLPADFKILFQGYSQVFDTIWAEFQGFFYIFQGPDGVYYNPAIGKNMKIAKYMKHSF